MEKQGTKINEIEIIPPEKLKSNYYDKDVIVSIYDSGLEIAKELEDHKFAKRCYYHNDNPVDHLKMQLSYSIYKERTLYYIIQCIKLKKRNVMIYGHKEDIVAIIKKFMLLDINEIMGISEDDFVVKEDDIHFINKTDLINMDLNQTMIIVLEDCEESVKYLISEYNLPSSSFVLQSGSNLHRLDYKTYYDPNIGYNTNYGIKKLSTMNANNPMKVGILGDSTATEQWFEKTWMDYLIDEANMLKIDLEIYSGAVGAHSSSLSLIKLIRDMSHMELDVVIYFSDSCEINGISENYFIHSFQKHLFEKLDKIKPKGIAYGKGISDKTENFFHQLFMMKAICQSFDIKFYAILPPALLLKKTLSIKEKELLEHKFLNVDFTEDNRTLSIKMIKNMANDKKYNWIHDFTDIFDHKTGLFFKDLFHLFDIGNEIVAKKIFELLKLDLKI